MEEERIREVMDLIARYGGIDGEHHKQWILDQIVRTVMQDKYREWVAAWNYGGDGPDTYAWDEGIAP
jgi:hypothetical protein